MFSFLKKSFGKLYQTVTQPFIALWEATVVDETVLEEIRRILLRADTGIAITTALIDRLTKRMRTNRIKSGPELKKALRNELITLMDAQRYPVSRDKQKEITQPHTHLADPDVIIVVGINGSGKTTAAAKLAAQATLHKKQVLLVAADTFRAAATDQLREWAAKTGVDFFEDPTKKDPSAVAFAALELAKSRSHDLVIIDTAGRLQTKVNLMAELAKLYRVVAKQTAGKTVHVLLVIDGMLGQNSFEQAKQFMQAGPIDGIILTKMDGTAKGGVVLAIVDTLKVPVAYITYGETVDSIKPFDATEYATLIVGE